MLFNSINYLVFFPIVVLVYFAIPDKAKRFWLLITSYYFYMCWNAGYVLLILFSTVVTYFCALLIEHVRTRRKHVLALCLTSNLLILFFFKYYVFATGTIERIMAALGITVSIPSFDVLLPVGISFYTFQALGYTIDVYRGTIKAERNIFKYALFVSFFPQLVAGPIERSASLLPQLDVPHHFDTERFRKGVLLMLWGFFMKIVIADRIAIAVDTVYGDIGSYPGLYQVIASVLFAFQIYCDFNGYSTIAIGSAKILGIDIMENFDAPYMGLSVAGFWRRWHISLTTWFKDYLYIPLGGNRCGKMRKYINKMIVFTLSGLWHGASWSFVFWGMLNGFYQVVGEAMMPLRKRILSIFHINTDSILYKLLAAVTTFVLIDFTWVFFRSGSIGAALRVLRMMFSSYNPEIFKTDELYFLGVASGSFRMVILCILILITADILKYLGISVSDWIMKQHMYIRASIVAFSILFILTFGVWGPAFDISNFIYFQF